MTNNPTSDQPKLADSSAETAWNPPRPQVIPRDTYSPAVLALAIVCLLWGLLTSYLISLLGLVLFVLASAGWIGELRHERE